MKRRSFLKKLAQALVVTSVIALDRDTHTPVMYIDQCTDSNEFFSWDGENVVTGKRSYTGCLKVPQMLHTGLHPDLALPIRQNAHA